MSAGLVLVLVAVSQTSSWHWLSAKTLGLIAAGVVLLALWVRVETRSRQPLVDMRMMRLRGVWTTNLVALLLGFGMYATFFLLPQFVETRRAGYGFNASVTRRRPLHAPLDACDAHRRLADRPARETVRLEAAADRRTRARVARRS